jgi:peroxiredoxin
MSRSLWTRVHWTVGALLVAASLATGALHAAATVGQPAPAFSALDSAGKSRSLEEFKGKTVVLEWVNFDCPFVKKHYGSGNMQKLQKAYTGKGVVWLSINSSAAGKEGHLTAATAEQAVRERGGAASALLLDATGQVGRLYGAKTTPHMFVIDARGTLAYAGAIDDTPSTDPADVAKAKNYLSAALDAVLAGKPVATASSQPYGCSVKY